MWSLHETYLGVILMIYVFSARKSLQANPCKKKCGDGMLCLIKPGGTERVCVCPENHYLSHDKKRCIANCTR